MSALYYAAAENLIADMRKRVGTDPNTWRCPCGSGDCTNAVVYARSPETRIVWFMATVSSIANPPMHGIENVEDFDRLLEATQNDDGLLWALWLSCGLREALLNAP